MSVAFKATISDRFLFHQAITICQKTFSFGTFIQEVKMNDLIHERNEINAMFICSSTPTSSSRSFSQEVITQTQSYTQ